ncbi:MAG: alpha/beta hydrolase [Clostridia bacterium]|nr:alpha/beta hydrolase [Clostridia bacterium]
MKIDINGLSINYEVYGKENKNVVVLLHGWGANLKLMEPIAKKLEDRYKVYAIDFPGFGESEEPKDAFNVTAYALVTLEFLKKNKIENAILIGHSFGGRVITKLVGELGYSPKKIIYVDAAGVKPKRSLNYYFKVYSYKLAKNMIKLFNSKEKADEIIKNLRQNAGSDDYKNASDNMKKTFINVVNEDLTHLFKNINVPALLIWGENDTDTPIREAKVFEKNIKDSGLVILKNAGHYSYLDKPSEFIIILNNFLEGE